MIQLETNTADQEIVLTLWEGRNYYDVPFTDYLLIIVREERVNTGLELAQVPEILFDSERYTRLSLTTETLTTPGRYRYTVYGQNSSSNLDPNDASVVGEIEQGWFNLVSNETYFEEPNLTIEDDTIAE